MWSSERLVTSLAPVIISILSTLTLTDCLDTFVIFGCLALPCLEGWSKSVAVVSAGSSSLDIITNPTQIKVCLLESLCVRARACVHVCVRACVCVCVVSVIVKRPVLPPSVVDGRSRNPLYYYYYFCLSCVQS